MSDMRESVNSELIARKIAEFHCVELEEPRQPLLFKTLLDWIEMIPDTYSNPDTQTLFQKDFNFHYLMAEVRSLLILIPV